MAVSGSTRMQVTTVELLVAGAALEVAANRWLQENLTEQELSVIGKQVLTLDEYADAFESLNKQLSSGKALKGLAQAVDFEVNTYNNKGLVTYITHDYLLDIMTDTTERQPTFTLPPFRKFADHESEVSWAYIKDPLYPNEVAWQQVFRRPIKGLEWTKEDYIEMKASEDIVNNPPKVSGDEVLEYVIGNEDDPSRYSRPCSQLVLIDVNGSATKEVVEWYKKELTKYSGGIVVRFGQISTEKISKDEIRIPVELPRTCTDILYHLLVKVAFNALSTGTMAKMGRVFGNWMVQVLPTNKKLIDRSTRIIASLANIPYEKANEEFFYSYYNRKPEDEYRESYVVETLTRLGLKTPTSVTSNSALVAIILIFIPGFIRPSITRTYKTTPLYASNLESNTKAFKGLSLIPEGAGTLATIASSTSSIPKPVFALVKTASDASIPITSSISCLTRSGSALGRSTLLITGIISKSLSKAK